MSNDDSVKKGRVVHFYAGKLIIIQSLGPNDYPAGEYLYNRLIEQSIQSLTIAYHSVETKEALFALLADILAVIDRTGKVPILHFAMHGDEDGIALASNEFIEWNDLAAAILPINIASGNNLFITMAACRGFNIAAVQGFDHKRSAFWSILGRQDSYSGGDFSTDYTRFYSTMAATGSLGAALIEINRLSPGFQLYNCERLFLGALKSSMRKSRGAGRGSMAHQLRMQLRHEGKPLPTSRSKFPEFVRDRFVDAVLHWRDSYFLVDLQPENDERFISRDKLRQLVVHEWKE